jgi:hypothetical protein
MSHAYQGMAAKVGVSWGKAHGYVVPEMSTAVVFVVVRVESSKFRGGSHTKIQPDRARINGAVEYGPLKPNGGKVGIALWLSHTCVSYMERTHKPGWGPAADD